MKVWCDATTGKHIRYAVAIAKRLRRKGHTVLITTRGHPDTVPLAKILKEKPVIIGKYDPNSLYTRLHHSLHRSIVLTEFIKHNLPDVAVCHQSPSLCRVAYGLNISVIVTADTPHATAVNKLTIPYASRLIVSEAIPTELYEKYNPERIVQYKGVDEVAWIQNFEPCKFHEPKHPCIVVRQMETKAVYAAGKIDFADALAKKLTKLGNVIFLPRYETERKYVDATTLCARADLVVSMGGTIAREAALQGTPSIVISELPEIHVNTYLEKEGFPIFTVDSAEAFNVAEQHLGKRWRVKETLAALENPLDVIENVLEEICNA